MSLVLFLLASAPVAVPDVELAQMRGGFALPGGLNVAMAVQTDTKVDGGLILRTIYTIDKSTPSLRIYAPERATAQAEGATSRAEAAAQGAVSVTFDRQSGARITMAGANMPQVAVSQNGASAIGAAANGAPIEAAKDGAAVAVPAGTLSVTSLADGQRIRLSGDGIDVSHLVGSAIGSAIENTGSNRVIETTTSVGLDISGATAANLGSSLLRVEGLALDATAAAMPR